MGKIIDGKLVSQQTREQLVKEVAELKIKNIFPGLAVVIVGEDPASKVYVRNKKRACEELGIYSEEYSLPEETTEKELLDLIDKLNKDSKINGILVQSPVPKHINESKVVEAISPQKDVDAFHAYNVGKIMLGDYHFLPCTPAGVIELIKSTGTQIEGKNCVVIGRSNIVGKPLSMLLLHENGTVTICHSKTKNLAEICKTADILVAAVGRANFVTADMVKEGAVVIDVGINRGDDGKLVGDVNFSEVEPIASYITPVPGGVGPMTITMLMRNTITAAKLQSNL